VRVAAARASYEYGEFEEDMHDRVQNNADKYDGRDRIAAVPRLYNFADDVLARNLTAGRSEKFAYIDPRGTWSYGQLAERVARCGNLLRSLGIRREQRILVCLTDTIDWPTSFLGAIKAGIVPVPVNTLMSEAEYRFILEDSRARLLIVSEELYARFANLISSCPDIERVLVSGNQGFGHTLFEDALQAAAATEYTAPTTRDEMCFWLYTSGSTGQPKAAVHVHAAPRFTNDCYGADVLGLTENDVVYSVSKLSFAYGLGNAMTFPLFAGATTVLTSERPTPNSVAELLQLHGVTVFFAVPTFYAGFLATNPVERATLRLRCCISAGEALPVNVGQSWSERFGVDILDGLGSTEMLNTFLSNRTRDVRYGTTGKPVRGYDIRLLDEAGNVVTQGEMGELQVRGPTAAIMYWNDVEQSRATFLGEWTRSGDKYIQDKDGYYTYCGRRDDMLKVGGAYVSPFEVESVLMSHPDVLEAAVAAWPGEDDLIRPKAFVVLKHSGKSSGAMELTLREHCRARLPPFKYPRWIEFRTELPKTATGKIQRYKLRAEAARDNRLDPSTPDTALRHAEDSDEKIITPSLDGGSATHSGRLAELTELWQTLLRQESIGIDDDFFETGGDSFLAIELLLEMERLTGKKLRSTILFQASTIRQLAEVLSAGEEVHRPVVRLSDGTRTPLFFFHGAFNTGGGYVRKLSKLLGSDQPLFVVAPHGLDDTPIPRSIEVMAADRVSLIREAHPNGPYRLAGYCLGGLVAFETARQLVDLGEDVDFVTMIDPPTTNARPSVQWLLRAMARARRFVGPRMDEQMMRTWYELTEADKSPHLHRQLLRNWKRFARFCLQQLIVNTSLSTTTSFSNSDQYAIAMSRYYPKPVAIPVVYLASEYTAEPWLKITPHMEIVKLTGDHSAVVDDPIEIARELRTVLDRSE
jgi:benzoate-CoA ligase family protein